jgi:ABC-type glycerol-3-phosphate transport system substrate-binding protein
MNFVRTEYVWKRVRPAFPIASAIVAILGTVYVLTTLGKEDQRLTIAVKQGVESIALKQIAEKFSRDKHIPVEVIELPYDDLYEEEQRQLAYRPPRQRDSIPPFDVIMVDDPWLYALVSDPGNSKGRRLTNLNELLKEKDNDFFPSTLRVSEYCPSGDHCSDYYAVPFVANSQLFAYRPADFKNLAEPKPTTWKQVVEDSKKIEDRGGIGYVTRIGGGNSIVTDFMPILWAYDQNSFPTFPTSEAPLERPEEAINALSALVATRKNLGSASFDDFDVSAYLQKQRASMGIIWSAWAMMLADIDNDTARNVTPPSSSTSSMSDCLKQITKLRSSPPAVTAPTTSLNDELIFDRVPLSSGQGLAQITEQGSSKPGPEMGVWLLAVPKEPEQKGSSVPVQQDLAMKFIKYASDLGDDPGAKRRDLSLCAAEHGTPPPRISVLEELEREPQFKDQHPSLIPAIKWSLNNGRARPRTRCWKKIELELGKYLDQLINQELHPTNITECGNQRLRPLFDEEKCMAITKSSDNEGACLEKNDFPASSKPSR